MTVLLTIVAPDGSARTGPTDGLGNFHWIPDQEALQEYQQATGLNIRRVTTDLAWRAYGIPATPVTPPTSSLTADQVRAVVKQELANVFSAGAQAA